MTVSYNKLWHLIIDKKMKKNDLQIASGLSTTTMAKLTKGRSVTSKWNKETKKYDRTTKYLGVLIDKEKRICERRYNVDKPQQYSLHNFRTTVRL